MAKGIASGLPLGAILARPEIMTWPPGSHATTFGGNPVACAAANATMKLLQAGLIENAASMGDILQAELSKLAHRFARISPPRGKGLMVAIDLLDEEGNLARNLRDEMVDRAFYKGLLLLGCGKAAIRFCPPLVLDAAQIRVAMDILGELFGEL
jgi:4-aminobutyrate aminotransferase